LINEPSVSRAGSRPTYLMVERVAYGHLKETLWKTLPLVLVVLGLAGPPYRPARGAVPVIVVAGASAPKPKRQAPARPPKPQDGAAHPESCRKLPAGKRIVKLNLKPETNVADLVAWISSITCAQLIVPDALTAIGKKVTIFAPELITPEEAYQLFLEALDSMGLTVVRVGHALQLIDIAKAKSAPIPFYGWEQPE